MNPQLNRSYKGFFPFKVGTTSYIYPDHIIPNVRMLAPYLDEIELVLFESEGQDNLPSNEDVENLVFLSEDADITYNVHLPIDVFLGDADSAVRNRGIRSVQKVISLTTPLGPSTYTLHLEWTEADRGNRQGLDGWKGHLYSSIEEILETGIEPGSISVETLHYPFELVEGIVEDFDLSVCLDLGHIISQGYSITDYAKRYLGKTPVVHLHGAQNGKDHMSVEVLGNDEMRTICGVLNDFGGIVSIEVFSFYDLSTSLKLLETRCRGE